MSKYDKYNKGNRRNNETVEDELKDEFDKPVEQTVVEEVELPQGTVGVKEEIPVEPPKAELPKQQPKQKGFTPVARVEFDLTAYAEAMAKNKAIDPVEGGKWQYSLLQILKSILNIKDQEQFNQEWNTVLKFFKDRKDDIFNIQFMFRFPNNWPGSVVEHTQFRRIVYTIINTCDPATRSTTIKEVNMSMVTEGLNENSKTRLLTFYNV